MPVRDAGGGSFRPKSMSLCSSPSCRTHRCTQVHESGYRCTRTEVAPITHHGDAISPAGAPPQQPRQQSRTEQTAHAHHQRRTGRARHQPLHSARAHRAPHPVPRKATPTALSGTFIRRTLTMIDDWPMITTAVTSSCPHPARGLPGAGSLPDHLRHRGRRHRSTPALKEVDDAYAWFPAEHT
jgi:hypothetical protein